MNPIRIGTRKSPLALWQAHKVQEILQKNGYQTEIVKVSSDGDNNLIQPLYKIGISGVFTKHLDVALLNNQIDIAVHSLKDVPTELPENLSLIACLPRAESADILVYKDGYIFQKDQRTIATGSLRRKAFWLNKFPNDSIEDLRGNVQLRLEKLIKNAHWDGAIFAFAGLERAEILEELFDKGLKYQILDWMIPAPSQGIIGVVANSDLKLPFLNDEIAWQMAQIERQFLNRLEGGCTAPIGANLSSKNGEFSFDGAILSLDGEEKIEIKIDHLTDISGDLGIKLADEAIAKGAGKLVQKIKSELNQ